MKYSLVVVLVFLVYLAVLTQAEGQGKPPRGRASEKKGGLKLKGKDRHGHRYPLPGGVGKGGIDVSVGVERLKVVSKKGNKKSGIKMIIWRELAAEHCKNPKAPEGNATGDGSQTGDGEGGDGGDQEKGCAGKPFHFALASLYEVDVNKTKVEEDGHSVDLMNAEFTCVDPGDALPEVGLTSDADSPQGVKISCSVELSDPPSATITVEVLLATENGTISIDDEDADVEEGEVKFNIEVSGWDFLDSSSGLNFEVEFGSKGRPKRNNNRRTATAKRRKPKDFEQDDGAMISFSEKVKSGGTYNTLEDDDIKLKEEGDKNVVVIFLPKGNPIFYDPTAQAGNEDSEDDDDNSAGGLLAPIATLTTMLFVALLSMM